MNQYKNKKTKNNFNCIKNIQRAGSIIFNPFVDGNELIKKKFKDGIIEHSTIDILSNVFNKKEYNDLIIFINFILPYCLPYDNKLDIVNSIETNGVNSLGISLSYENHIIKIVKINDENSISNIINEINNGLPLFFYDNGEEYQDVPIEINKIYGYITSNINVYNGIYIKNKKNEEYNKYNIYTNNNYGDDFIKKINLSIGNLNKNNDKIWNDSIGILITENILMNANECLCTYKKYPHLNNSKLKSNYIKVFMHSILNALNYINGERLYVHNDIKLENIVVSKHRKFQLINFGLIQKINAIEDVVERVGGTPIFYSTHLYNKYTSVLYDWNCVLFSLLNSIGIFQTYEHDEKNNEYVIYIFDYDCNQIINNISSIMDKIKIQIDDMFDPEYDIFKEKLLRLILCLFYTMNIHEINHSDKGTLIPFRIFNMEITNNKSYLIVLTEVIYDLIN